MWFTQPLGYVHQNVTSCDIYFIKGLQSATTKMLAYIFVISQKSPSSQSILSDVGTLSNHFTLMNNSHSILMSLF